MKSAVPAYLVGMERSDYGSRGWTMSATMAFILICDAVLGSYSEMADIKCIPARLPRSLFLTHGFRSGQDLMHEFARPDQQYMQNGSYLFAELICKR